MADELYKAVTESISFGLHYALPVALIASSLGACKGGLARDDAAAGWVGPLRWGGLVCMHTKPQQIVYRWTEKGTRRGCDGSR